MELDHADAQLQTADGERRGLISSRHGVQTMKARLFARRSVSYGISKVAVLFTSWLAIGANPEASIALPRGCASVITHAISQKALSTASRYFKKTWRVTPDGRSHYSSK